METKELQNRNTAVLHQFADIIETVPSMSLIISKLLYEKGLEIPASSQQSGSVNASRAKSRMSMRSSGRVSECSLSVNSRDDGAFFSKCLSYFIKIFRNFLSESIIIDVLVIFVLVSERTFASSSSSLSNVSKTSTTKSKKSEKTMASSSSSLNFHVSGQSIRGDKATK